MNCLKKKVMITQYEASLFLTLLITLFPAFGVMIIQVRQDNMLGEMNNLRIYLVTAIIFVFMLAISMLICKFLFFPAKGKTGRNWNQQIWVGSYSIYVLMLLLHIWLLAKCYVNSANVYPHMSGEWLPWHQKSDWKVFTLMTIVGILAIVISFWCLKLRKIVETFRFPLYVIASIIGGASMYCDNLMSGDILHGNAYYTSVYTALQNAPYDYSNQSIYGHYAIFLKYPVKLLGGDYTAFNIVISMVGALSIFLVALALDLCVRNHFISICATWAMPMMFLYYPKNHWQMFPHRVLFAGVMLYVIARYFHKHGKWMRAVGYVLAGASILWNTETGIICMAAWFLASVMHNCLYEHQSFKLKVVINSILHNVAYSFITVFGIVVLFNIYNMPLGEEWHGIRFLLFPLDSGWDTPSVIQAYAAESSAVLYDSQIKDLWIRINNSFASGLVQPLIYEISPWYFVFLLLGIAVIIMLIRIMHNRVKENDCIMGMAALLALGQLYYFFNRPCFDYLAIALFETVLILAILADEDVDRKRRWVKRPIQALFVSILAVLSVLTIWQAQFRFSQRADEGYYDNARFEELLEEINRKVPKDTFAFGQGIQEIYAQLGWDTGCHLADYSSWSNTHSVGTVIVEASHQEECVISVRSKKKNGKISAEEYMGYWGFENEAVTVKEQWSLDTDEAWYWDIYYVDIDKSIPNIFYEKNKNQLR